MHTTRLTNVHTKVFEFLWQFAMECLGYAWMAPNIKDYCSVHDQNGFLYFSEDITTFYSYHHDP